MLYQHRWILSLLLFSIISSFSYFYILSPRWIALTHLQADEKKLTNELLMLNLLKAQQPHLTQNNGNRYQSPMQMLSELVALIHRYHLSMQSIVQMHTALCHKCMLTHVILQGNVDQLINFLLELRQENGMLIEEFSSKVINLNQITVIADIIQLNSKIAKKNNGKNVNIKEFQHLFCLGKDRFFDQPMLLKMVPLAALKFMGFMQWNNHRQAILQLPNRTIESVAINAIVGKEHARLTKIDTQQIVFVLPNHKTWIINRE